LGRRDSIFPLLRCQGVWNKTCTQLTISQTRRTTVLEMFKDSAIILDAIRRPLLTKSATAAASEMFTSVRVDFGGPYLSSSSTSSLPSQNRKYHIKTFDRFGSSFP
jgi:hypothetical protein